MKNHLLPVVCLSLLAILSGLLTVLPRTAFAAAACNYQVTTTTTGVDVEECSSYVWPSCSVCTDCCMVSSFAQMAMQYFNDYRSNFIMNSFYQCPIDTSLQNFANQLRNSHLFKITAKGGMIDGAVINDTLLTLSATNAESIKAYTPSDQICKFGTLTRSLSGSEAKMDADRIAMSEMGLVKNLGKANSISAAGRGTEYKERLHGFVDKFCSLKDNDEGLSGICMSATPVDDINLNRDLDYTRLMNHGVSINGDFTDSDEKLYETSLITMAHYLYGHRQPTNRYSFAELTENQAGEEVYKELRSVAARRAAAQNTFNTLSAMRLAGSGKSDTYIRDVLKNIGLSGGNADMFLGAKMGGNASVNTSYNGQMNLLTKQIYQDPAFYANLMDSKTNVKRTSASLQAIGLMQARDTYKSMARSEMLAALLVEMEARRVNTNVFGQKTQ